MEESRTGRAIQAAGTPGYVSPEQAKGSLCTARSDQYSFCVAMAECLLGQASANHFESGKTATTVDLAGGAVKPSKPKTKATVEDQTQSAELYDRRVLCLSRKRQS